ncbi:preprotein translocase subunit SecE [Rubrobacter taiwanensis]|jgi:preprotein translocase subunit SecE|uniref:Protein translocase subunit SecE n=1 Tax=Rubrobacter taiwanensis TaxID=185139 RepID=A0A4R1BMP3_9ACTN|nr:preprotein translocase subunit SecE [Rubrobacter taiwanensis]TCJ18685.1 preprotein translocase subunit SecE [Rubrobacter taiwanensis]
MATRKKSPPSSKKGAKKGQQKREKRRFGSGAVQFARDVRNELKKVTWPDREQLQQSTMVVLLIVIALGIYIAIWDYIFQNLARLIFL